MAGDAEDPLKSKSGEKQKTDLVDYLNAPRRKRKTYVVLAYSPNVSRDLATKVETFVRQSFSNFSVVYSRTEEEFIRNLGRQIGLLIYDDEFLPLEQGLGFIQRMKEKRTSKVVPVLFLTRDQNRLVQCYNKQLLAFHEADDFVNYVRATPSELLSRVRFNLKPTARRRSRRFPVDIAVRYECLGDSTMRKGSLLDLSVHGALLQCADNHIFKEREQIRLHIPTEDLISQNKEEFFKLAGRVRRLLIVGTKVGLSFEHLTDQHSRILVEYITALHSQGIKRKGQQAKLRAYRAAAKAD